MRVFFDTEFIEDGKTIELISIGMVREDGGEYYAESAEVDLARASDWVRENVLPSLSGRATPRAQIAREVVEFCGPSPTVWAYYAAYDWVALCQLFGTMMDLPKGWPMFCRDIIQSYKLSGSRVPLAPKGEHNALVDARWNMAAWRALPDAFAGRKPG
jgi:hypothetical protein